MTCCEVGMCSVSINYGDMQDFPGAVMYNIDSFPVVIIIVVMGLREHSIN